MNCCLHLAFEPLNLRRRWGASTSNIRARLGAMNHARTDRPTSRRAADGHRRRGLGMFLCPGIVWAAATGDRSRSGSWKGIGLALALAGLLLSSCGQKSPESAAGVVDPPLTTNGTVEITARLVEVPEGAIFKRELYDYATILKYQVLKVHRGEVKGDTVYVGHYNPWKPRREAADRRVKGIGGNVRQFEAGQVHRLALEVPIEDHFMGGIVNKYFGRATGSLYWAVWTNRAEQ